METSSIKLYVANLNTQDAITTLFLIVCAELSLHTHPQTNSLKHRVH
uniref:Uncharacterized protein n=1 Tax=Anguilla anguilla TaxID=7936 RepID=A0A0E9XR37_ANGAN